MTANTSRPPAPSPDPALVYPRLIRRVRALVIDSLLIPIAALATLIIGDALGVSGVVGKLLLFFVPIFLLEPVMVSLTGGTVGHHLCRIKVTRRNGVDRLNLAAAVLRFLMRLSFGWFSFLLVLTTRRRQALHDLAARSIVTLRDPAAVPPCEALPENAVEEAGYAYPAAWKRVAAIVLYCIAAVVANGVLGTLALSEACLMADRCSDADRLVLLLANLLLVASLAAVIVFGWKARLYGCRRKPLPA